MCPPATTDSPVPDPSSPTPVAWSLSLSLSRLDSDVGGGARGDGAESLTPLLTSRARWWPGTSISGSQFPHLENGRNTTTLPTHEPF